MGVRRLSAAYGHDEDRGEWMGLTREKWLLVSIRSRSVYCAGLTMSLISVVDTTLLAWCTVAVCNAARQSPFSSMWPFLPRTRLWRPQNAIHMDILDFLWW